MHTEFLWGLWPVLPIWCLKLTTINMQCDVKKTCCRLKSLPTTCKVMVAM
jgi:hypothetical protein